MNFIIVFSIVVVSILLVAVVIYTVITNKIIDELDSDVETLKAGLKSLKSDNEYLERQNKLLKAKINKLTDDGGQAVICLKMLKPSEEDKQKLREALAKSRPQLTTDNEYFNEF